MKVFDNIISKKDQKFIKNNLLDNGNFPWSYVSDVSKKGNTHQRRPGFKHIFKNYNLIEPILVNTKAKLKYVKDEILEARSFLQLPLDKNFIGKGVDTPHLDRTEPHLVVLYYVNDSDGDTRFWSNTDNVPNLHKEPIFRYTPKKGTGVLFPSETWHCSSNPISSDYRMVINYIFQPTHK